MYSEDRDLFKVLRQGTAVLLMLTAVISVLSCSMAGKIRDLISGGVKADISMPVTKDIEPEEVMQTVEAEDHVEGEPIIMNAQLDEDSGEMVAVDVISESRVVARFNNVSERLGQVSISFDIVVPSSLLSSDLQLRFSPVMHIGSEDRKLESLNLTGAGYRGRQLKGYQRYR